MTKFQIILTEHAVADLQAISKELRNQVHRDIKQLQSAPFPAGTLIKRLKGYRPPVYRLRSGDFRVLYHIGDGIVTILRVIDRKLLERILRRLKL
jgi:mRNA-degrading endonuclease RelE of RelBE toxin-antitoxin system